MISPVSAPQRGHGPSSTRSGRSFSLSSAAIWSTVSFVNSAIPFMNASRSPRPRHLVFHLRRDAAHGLTLLERWDLAAFLLLVLRLPLVVGLHAVHGAPPGLERDLAARAEALLLDERDHRRARVPRRRMED